MKTADAKLQSGSGHSLVMQPRISPNRWLKLAAIAFVVVCLLVDLLPRHTSPDFRYTGSDPSVPGWPLALFIYDPKYGFQVGPFAYLMLPFQLGVLVVGLIVVAVVRRLHNQPM